MARLYCVWRRINRETIMENDEHVEVRHRNWHWTCEICGKDQAPQMAVARFEGDKVAGWHCLPCADAKRRETE